LRELGNELHGAQLTGPSTGQGDDARWSAFVDWALMLARGLASGDSGTWPWADWTPNRWNGGRGEIAAT
jgi:hypothetical protein